MNFYFMPNRYSSTSVAQLIVFLFLLLLGQGLSAKDSPFSPSFIKKANEALSQTFRANPFVALPGQMVIGPEPNQLRFQDLRGVECYAQPDRLEVCGAPDTIAFMLFTKSEEDLTDISINLKFGEGIESFLFAYTPEPDGGGIGSESLDTISVQNPESPTFFLNEIRQGDGAVIVYVGIRAECGVDFDQVDPNITFTFNYTAPGGVPCELVVTPEESYASNVIVPKVEFADGVNIPNAVIRNSDDEFCQNVTFTQTTPSAKASGAIFSINEYGFDEGIMFSSIAVNGEAVPAADYTIDPTSGVVNIVMDGVENPTYFGDDGLLAFGENIIARVCYTLEGCLPNNNIPTNYGVVSACDGEICTGPADIVDGLIDPAFITGVDFANNNIYRTISSPVVCGPGGMPTPYVFEFDIADRLGRGNPIDDQITDIRANLQACAPSPFGDPIFEVVLADGSTAMVDDGVVRVVTEDEFNAAGTTLIQPAGTIILDFRRQTTDIGGGFVDFDGDGAFDDKLGGEVITIRITLPVSCDASGGCISSAPGDDICQYNRIRLDGLRRCNQAGVNEIITLNSNPEFTSSSRASFSNAIDFNFPEASSSTEFSGYNFGKIGVTSQYTGATTPPDPKPTPIALPAQTRTLEFQFTIDDSDFLQCPATNPGEATLAVRFNGDSRLLRDMVFSNVMFEGAAVADADTVITYSDADGLVLTVNDGLASAGTYTYSIDVTMDTNFCSPPQLILIDAFIQSACSNGCDCSATRACSSTTIRVDPDDQCCLCLAETELSVNRLSTGFTDESRTQRVDWQDIPSPDNRRFVSGDTMRIEYKLYFNRGQDLSEFNSLDRFLSFEARFAPFSLSFNQSDEYEAIWDYQAARLQVAEVRRANGSIIKLGDIYSGPNQKTNSGVRIGSSTTSETENTDAETGEVFHPAFPNGGYQFGSGNSGTDQIDGHILAVQLGNLNGAQDALSPLFDALGGGFVDLDSFVMVWHVPVIDNPGLNTPSPSANLPVVPWGSATKYVGDPANNVSSSISFICNRTPALFEYASPKVGAESRVDYTDNCDGEIVHKFTLSLPNKMIDDNWFATEWRPINGVERFEMDFPLPYYYPGGTTVEAIGVPAYVYEPDSSLRVDTAVISTGINYYPSVGESKGQLIFNDSEFENEVRADAYDDFGLGDDDITTIGGDWPLIATGLGMTDSLVFRIPISRLCGIAPTPASALNMTYQAASRHLADYNGNPYVNNSTATSPPYWTNVPDPDATFYFSYDRLGGEFRNPHRQEPTTTTYMENNVPEEFNATASIGSGTLTDIVGASENNTYTLTPPAGQALNGVVSVAVDNSVELIGLTSGGAAIPFTLATSTDSNKVYSLDIPALAVDEAFVLDLETDLSFCDEGRICINALVPCGDDPAPELLAELNLECSGLNACYNYLGGVPDLFVEFSEPMTLPICGDRELSVSFTNNGSSIITDFSPVLFIPEGVEADETSFVATLSTGGSMALTGFANDPALDDVFGLGYEFPDGTLDALLGADGLNPGETLTLTFMAETTCDITSGLPLAVDVNGITACGGMLDILPVIGEPIDVNVPEAQSAEFTFNVETPIELSCSEEGTELLLTAINTGKVGQDELQICLRLPAGTRTEPTQIRPITPESFVVDPATIERTPIGTMGGEQICFPGPSNLEMGAFFCANIPIFVDNLDCGERAIGVFLTRKTTVNCAITGMDCEIDVLTSAMPYLPIKIVPPVSLITADLFAECTDTPGTFDVPFVATIEAPTEDFFGVSIAELYFDVDGSGTLDDFDELVGAPISEAINITAGEEGEFTGTFTGIDQSKLCPLLLVLKSDGCQCDEIVLPFPSVRPDFLADLGEGISLCPGESFILDSECAPAAYRLANPAAGTVVDDGAGMITVTLNPGFGVSNAENLLINQGFGNCAEEIEIPIRQFEDFSFPDLAFTVCNVGCQEVDLNIPASIQDDVEVMVTPNDAFVVDGNTAEPKFCDVPSDRTYEVSYMLNGSCMATSMITIDVFEQPSAVLTIEEGCSTGFSLTDNLTTVPADLGGDFDSDGDGSFTPGKDIPGEVNYIPGPLDIERGFVRIDFQTEDPEGPCGPIIVREVFNLKIVDCGTYPWNGGND